MSGEEEVVGPGGLEAEQDAEDEVKLSPFLQDWISGWVDGKSKSSEWTLPTVDLKTGKLSKPLDPHYWPSCYKDCPRSSYCQQRAERRQGFAEFPKCWQKGFLLSLASFLQ